MRHDVYRRRDPGGDFGVEGYGIDGESAPLAATGNAAAVEQRARRRTVVAAVVERWRGARGSRRRRVLVWLALAALGIAAAAGVVSVPVFR